MKLRMLNGTHSALAYLGYLAGYETIAAAVADPAFRAYVAHLWRNEIIPALDPPPGVDLNDYSAALLDRYGNPAIAHRTWQIAMDGEPETATTNFGNPLGERSGTASRSGPDSGRGGLDAICGRCG